MVAVAEPAACTTSAIDHSAKEFQSNDSSVYSRVISSVYSKQTSCSICHRSANEAPIAHERHSSTAEPPVWPERFHVQFEEYTEQFTTHRTERGSFHLDYVNERMRWEHGKGQYNNWCECAGLPANESAIACDVLSVRSKWDAEGAAYIMFQSLNFCCRLAGWDKGFGPIRPDWLTRPVNATFMGSQLERNRTCYRWANMNHGNPLMQADEWSEDAMGVPCSYKDRFAWWSRGFEAHNLTFDATTYSTDAEPDGVFDIPPSMDCSKKCPNRHTWCFFTTKPWAPPAGLQ